MPFVSGTLCWMNDKISNRNQQPLFMLIENNIILFCYWSMLKRQSGLCWWNFDRWPFSNSFHFWTKYEKIQFNWEFYAHFTKVPIKTNKYEVYRQCANMRIIFFYYHNRLSCIRSDATQCWQMNSLKHNLSSSNHKSEYSIDIFVVYIHVIYISLHHILCRLLSCAEKKTPQKSCVCINSIVGGIPLLCFALLCIALLGE